MFAWYVIQWNTIIESGNVYATSGNEPITWKAWTMFGSWVSPSDSSIRSLSLSRASKMLASKWSNRVHLAVWHTNIHHQGIFLEGENAEKTHLLFDKVYGLVGVHVKVGFLDNGGPWVGFVLRIHPEILSFLGVIFNLEFRTMLLRRVEDQDGQTAAVLATKTVQVLTLIRCPFQSQKNSQY